MRSHGVYATYCAGCRCGWCKSAASKAQKEYRSRRGRTRHSPSGAPAKADPMRWAERAVCRTVPIEVMFPTGPGRGAYHEAKAVCAGCPVTAECLAYALKHEQWDGCWGGLTPDERSRISA